MIKLLSFSFQGRSGRLHYWRVQLLAVILGGAVGLVSLLAIQSIGSAGGLLFLGYLPVFGLTLAASVRRLHDRGKSGWWYLLFVVGPFACSSAAQGVVASGDPLVGLPFSLAGIALGLWGLVEIGFLRGEPKANAYGEDPMAATQAAAVAALFS
jgi:uncharacterized membrane protein YhaH (DUF805 family)